MLVRAGVILTFLMTGAWIAYTDIQKQKIYNEAVAALLVPAIVSFFVFPEITPGSRIAGGVSVSGLMLLISLFRPGAFGGGDIKFAVPLGLFLGLRRMLYTGGIAVFLAAFLVVCRIICQTHKEPRKQLSGRQSSLPFGPAMYIGGILSWFV